MGEVERGPRQWERLLLAVSVVLSAVAVPWLAYQGWRLLVQPGPDGAIDLRLRCVEARAWFGGQAVYGEIVNAVYPPASCSCWSCSHCSASPRANARPRLASSWSR